VPVASRFKGLEREPPAALRDSFYVPSFELLQSFGARSRSCERTILAGLCRHRRVRVPRNDIPELSGVYLYGDCGSGRIWGAFRDEADRWTSVDLLDTPYAMSTFGEDQAWEIYLTDHAYRSCPDNRDNLPDRRVATDRIRTLSDPTRMERSPLSRADGDYTKTTTAR
jgi:hypothetical protein